MKKPTDLAAPVHAPAAEGSGRSQADLARRARNDPFVERFYSRISLEAAASFSDDQLLALKQAFADQMSRMHSIDIRMSLPFLFTRYYVVFIAGPERRQRARRRKDAKQHRIGRLANIVFLLLFVLVVLSAVLGLLYLLKSLLGLDLLPDTSLGLWDAIRQQVRHLWR